MVVVAFIIGELAALVGVNWWAALIIFIITIVVAVATCYGLFLVDKNVKFRDKIVWFGCGVALLVGYYAYNMQAQVYERYDKLQYGSLDNTEYSERDFCSLDYTEYSERDSYNLDYTQCWEGNFDSDTRISVSGEVTAIMQKEYGYIVELQVAEGYIWLQLQSVEGIKYGATLSASGVINPMKRADNPGNYDEREYMHSNGVVLKLKVDGEENVVSLGDKNDYSFLKDLLYRIRGQAVEILKRQCDKKEMGLLSAIVLGEKSYMDEEINELYSANSIAHVLSISGLHILVIGMGLYKILRMRMRYISSATVSATVIILFAIMTGSSVSAVRAVIMFVMHVVADVLGRKYDMLSAISLSGLVLLWDNPFYITNASFILSYSAMLAVAITAPIVIEFFKTENGFVKTLLFNVSLTITSMPVNMCLFYRISTYSILLNLLVVPFMGMMLAMALLGMVVSVFSELLGEACLGTSVYILRFYEWLCRVAEELPAASVVTGGLSPAMIFVYYTLLMVLLWFMHRMGSQQAIEKNKSDVKRYGKLESEQVDKHYEKLKSELVDKHYEKLNSELINNKYGVGKRRLGNARIIDGFFRKKQIGVIIIILIIMIFLVYRQKYKGFELCFLDVGQGDCAYIHSPSGNDYLIDCGSTDESNIGKYKLESFLEYKDVDDIECVFISHCDTDHMSGVLELIERGDIAIEKLALPVIERNSPSDNGRLLATLALKHNIEVMYIEKGKHLKDADLEFVCLSPEEKTDTLDINEASMVLLMRYKSLVTFFAGDIGASTERLLVDDISRFMKQSATTTNEKQTVIYKVAHHGSMYSSSAELLAALQPDIAVISCGEDNTYGHPHEETIQRLDSASALVLVTFDIQAVMVKYDEKIEVRCHGKPP